jgi:hypothetical protein
MFDYNIKILPNNRILIRNNDSKHVSNVRADEVSHFFENVLKEQLEAQESQDNKVADIRKQAEDK